jgi:hypothetical protein
MARLNEILVGRIAKSYQRVFGMKGPVPVATLAPEIMPTHALFHGVEDRYLETWNRYAISVDLGPTAANLNPFRLNNPTNSNTIVVLESILLATGVANVIQITLSNVLPNLGALDTSFSIDFRNPAASMSVASHSNAAVAVGSQLKKVQFVGAGSFEVLNDEDQEIALISTAVAPASITFIQSNVNTAYTVSLIWRERFLEESERI